MKKKSSRLRFLIKSKTLFSWGIYRLGKMFHRYDALDPIAYTNRLGKAICGYDFHAENPRSFNEKICYLKLFYRNPLWERVADKHEVKVFLQEIGLGEYVPKEYGVYSSSKEIHLDSLPDEFVLKATHDCGSVFLCKKGQTNFKEVFEKLDASLKSSYKERNHNFEWVYENIHPRIIAEEFLHPYGDFKDIMDWKFCMANHRFLWGYITKNRECNLEINPIDEEENLLPTWSVAPPSKQKDFLRLKKIPYFGLMKEISLQIARYFDFVRVDFMVCKEGLRISELTFFPTSGIGCFSNKKVDFELGEKFDLSFTNPK